jgi:TIR domain
VDENARHGGEPSIQVTGMATAFISHATEDHEVAERICAFLEERGIRCWIAPRDVRPGRRYGEEIVNAIQNANAVILILSESANASKFVEREIERAVNYGKPTLPVRVREVQPSRSLELFISDAHWIDAWKPPMEQYLDRLADSIRSLSPDAGDSVERPPDGTRLLRKKKPNFGKRVAIGLVLLVLVAAAGGAAWWFWKRSTPVSPLPQNPSAAVSPSPVSTPAPESPPPTAVTSTPPSGPSPTVAATPARGVSPNERSATPQPSPSATRLPTVTPSLAETTSPREMNRSVADVLEALGNLQGMARYSAIRQQERRLPAEISVDDLLALTRGTSRRSDAIEILFAHLSSPLTVDDVLKVLGSTSGMERYGLLRLFAQRLPREISVDQLLDLINNTSRRSDVIGTLFSRLPSPLPVTEVLRVLGSTSGMERYGLIRLFAQRLPEKISVDELLAIISNTSRRSDAIQLLFPRLPYPLPVTEVLRVFGSTSGMERYGLIRLFAQRLPTETSVDQLLALINNTSRRNDAIELLSKRLHNPLSVGEMLSVLGSTSGMERYNLIRILASRAPKNLSQKDLSTLVQGSSRPESGAQFLQGK